MTNTYNLQDFEQIFFHDYACLIGKNPKDYTKKEKELLSGLKTNGIIGVHSFGSNRTLIIPTSNVGSTIYKIVDDIRYNLFFDCDELVLDSKQYGLDSIRFLILSLGDNTQDLDKHADRIKQLWPYKLY
jgi:hypothetical protein